MNMPRGIKWLVPLVLFLGGLMFFSDPQRGNVMTLVYGNACFVALVVWMYFRCRHSSDEVVRAANEAALSIGAPIGLGLAFTLIFIVRLHPGASSLVEGLAGGAREGAAVSAGFGLGVLATCFAVVLSSVLVWGCWWLSKR